MANFLNKMLASGESDTVSHKRFVSIISIIMLVSLAFLSCFGYPPAEAFIYVFAVLTGGESMLTVIEKIKGGA